MFFGARLRTPFRLVIGHACRWSSSAASHLLAVPGDPNDRGGQNSGGDGDADSLSLSSVHAVLRPYIARGVRVAQHRVPTEKSAAQSGAITTPVQGESALNLL